MQQLQGEQSSFASSLEEHSAAQNCPEAQGDIGGVYKGRLQAQETAERLKGEGGAGLTVRASVAGQAGAAVAVQALAQERFTCSPVQALMSLTAHQRLTAVLASVQDAVLAL